ncbi:MAG: polysaccharide biosynthesis C-terminal domain-containing protein, partial [Candidatus Kapaibacterium sp.]
MRQQLRQLSGDTAIYGVATIVQRFLSFLLTPFYTHVLTRAEVGIQATVFVMIAFVMIVANAGMEAAYFRYHSAAESEDERRGVYWNALLINLIVAASIGIAIVLFPAGINRISFLDLPPEYFHLIRMAGAIIFLDSAATITMALLRMSRRPKMFGGIKIITILVNVGMNILLVAYLRMGLKGVFLAGIVQSLVQLLLTLPLVTKMLPVVFSRQTGKKLLKFGVPTIASGIAMIALQGIDRPIMKQLTSDDIVGLYSATYRLGIPMMMFVSMFEFAWRPFFLQQANKPNAKHLYARIFTYFNVAAALLFLAISFYIVDIVASPLPFTHGRSIIPPNYWSGLAIVPIILAAYAFNGWYTNFIVGIYIEKKTKALPWITGIGAGIEALLCFLLIPSIGIYGGAWGTFAAYVVMAIVLYRYVQRYYRIDYEWGRVLKVFIGVIAIYGVNMALFRFDDRSLTAALIRLGLLAAFPAWLFASGFF